MDKMRAKLQVIRDLADNCPGHFWEETVAMIRDEAEAALTPSPWIPCAERLPTDADEDIDGLVWRLIEGRFVGRATANEVRIFSKSGNYTHWKPTGLVRPEPPEVEA